MSCRRKWTTNNLQRKLEVALKGEKNSASAFSSHDSCLQLVDCKNVDSWTRPSRWIRIWSVWDTIKTRLVFLARTTLRRHLRHSKTMAQACSSVMGAEKLPVISSKFKQASALSWQGDQEVSQNRFSGGEAMALVFCPTNLTFHSNWGWKFDKNFRGLLVRKFCVQLLSLCQRLRMCAPASSLRRWCSARGRKFSTLPRWHSKKVNKTDLVLDPFPVK